MRRTHVIVIGLFAVVLFAGCGKDVGESVALTETVIQAEGRMGQEKTVSEQRKTGPEEMEEVNPTTSFEGFGIMIGEEFHAFDAKTGITDFQKIDGRVNVCQSEIEVKYYEEGSSEPKGFEPEKEPEFGVYEGDLVSAYWVYRHRWFHTADKLVVSSVFRINRDYRTDDGLCGDSTYEDALSLGYRPYMQNEAVRIFDCKGEADWKEAERLAEQAISENSFACLKHLEDPFCSSLGDIFKMHYLSDDVSAFLEQLDRSYNQPPKDTFIGMIALAMEVQKIQNGEIDSFVMYAVSFYYEEKKGFLPLEIHVYTKAENIEQWDESWGVNIQ